MSKRDDVRIFHIGEPLSFGLVDVALQLPLSLSVWVKPSATARQAANANIYANNRAEYCGIVLQQNQSHQNQYRLSYGTGSAWRSSAPITLHPGVWQHVTTVVEQTQMKTYVSRYTSEELRTLQKQQSITGLVYGSAPIRWDAEEWFRLGHGSHDCTQRFEGDLCDLRVYEVVLTSLEASAIAAEGGVDAIVRFPHLKYRLTDLPTGTGRLNSEATKIRPEAAGETSSRAPVASAGMVEVGEVSLSTIDLGVSDAIAQPDPRNMVGPVLEVGESQRTVTSETTPAVAAPTKARPRKTPRRRKR